MTNRFLTSTKQIQPKTTEKKAVSAKNRMLWNIGAGIGLLGGTGLLFAAVFLTIFEYFYGENLHGNWLYLAVLPLWVIGAVCMDKAERDEKAKRSEYCKRNGIKDKDCAGKEYSNW